MSFPLQVADQYKLQEYFSIYRFNRKQISESKTVVGCKKHTCCSLQFQIIENSGFSFCDSDGVSGLSFWDSVGVLDFSIRKGS